MHEDDGPLVLKVIPTGWSASIRTLPCRTAEAPTIEEALRILAAEMHAYLAEHGPTPEYLQNLEQSGLSRTIFEAHLARAAGARPARRHMTRSAEGLVEVLQIKVTLRDIRPRIWRRLS